MLSQVPSWALWIPFLSAIFGGVVTGAVTFFINKTNKESEEKKHRKELAVKLAIEDYKQTWEFIIKKDQSASIPPLDLFVLHHIMMSEAILSDKEITEEKYLDLIKKYKSLEKAHKQFIHLDNDKA
ncbi:hypothetical protein [Candidatus Contendibacter odensensis]|uniref:Uncharacterized protein n=1 Tax=Candidatus Contendobacter odensis Run_B_J11 TaxID=1400861 RepID=A0A7U7J5N6_9GAMM|nr:hypothetical protein [Candidatus Contendobacter odensis]MBK8752868.1 hypothetical protein [Candidatus Competibacteraceae bacterium]CDH47017.1 hypothetical protein BN874_70001 [Candidatus Contendobacter odensis Run_B_J11]